MPQLTQESAVRIRASYAVLAPRVDSLVERFYSRMFESHPEIRAMFPADMARQKEHLAVALAIVCRNIDCLDILQEALMELGASHAVFGVRNEQYAIVVKGLVETMRFHSGAAWTPALEADWTAAFEQVSATMQRGAARLAVDAARALGDKRPGARASSPGWKDGRPPHRP